MSTVIGPGPQQAGPVPGSTTRANR